VIAIADCSRGNERPGIDDQHQSRSRARLRTAAPT
jgi:hypothetical protein